ncbi:MAG: SDR family oxidoreductase [Syntrophomonadaceae bacterium]|jgi:glucose 1-dehydrogenase|nr:SDR family oxidoreductase [Syntrophomonadaceae bacterium]
MVELNGKVVIITGGAMGMGAATAELMAQAGGKIVIADFNEELGRQQTQKIIDAGGTAAFINTDVSNPKNVEAMVQFAVDTYGRLDGAVNNAARTPDSKPLADMDDEEFDALIGVDLKGVALCMKYELRQMMKQNTGGSIVNISSVSGIRPQPANPIYVAAKFGVNGLTKQAAMDYSCNGIRINAVAPGAIDTPMLRGALQQFGFDPEAYAKQLSMLGRFAQADEVAQANLWLISDLASYITGAIITVDGGYTAM